MRKGLEACALCGIVFKQTWQNFLQEILLIQVSTGKNERVGLYIRENILNRLLMSMSRDVPSNIYSHSPPFFYQHHHDAKKFKKNEKNPLYTSIELYTFFFLYLDS